VIDLASASKIKTVAAIAARPDRNKTVADNIREVRPTILVSVPRLFEKIYAKVMVSAESGNFIKKGLFRWALGVGRKAVPYFNKEEQLPGFLGQKWALADSLVFSKVKEKTGGRLKYMVSGGAPLAKEIADFFIGMGLRMVEGYGLTETSPVLTLNPLALNEPGTVGPPLAEVEIRIAEDGEILARGPNLMRGYYKNPTATNEAIQDGWFHTGDIGRLDEDGYLQITDRKKDLLVTSGGKNIAPQPLENALKLSPLIEQAVILGDKRNFIAALIVPPWETIDEWCPRHGWPATIEECINHEGFRKALDNEVASCMQNFAHFERVKKFEIIPSPFLVETGELTPSMKVKRKVVNEKYADVIEGIYQK
jgi:long-chain acyl-CoA synthetase